VTALELLVLIVPDLGLRSALVGRLSLHGESLVTVPEIPGDAALDRLATTPATLIVDARSVGTTLSAMRRDPRWGGIIVLADRAAKTPPGKRFSIVERADAINRVSALLDGWRTPNLTVA